MTLTYQPGCIPGYGMPVMDSRPALCGKDLVRHVLRNVGATRGIDPRDILGDSRLRLIVYARQEVAWRLYQFRDHRGYRRFSMPQIGRYLRRDHTTILHAIRAHEKRMERPA